jgi:hypothetical protein
MNHGEKPFKYKKEKEKKRTNRPNFGQEGNEEAK